MEALLAHRYRQTTVVFYLCAAFLAGVGLAHTGRIIDSSWWWISLTCLVFTLRRKNIWTIFWVVAFGLSLGWWRGSAYMVKLADYDALYGQKVTITAVAANDAVYGYSSQLSFDAKHVKLQVTDRQLTGKIAVSGFGAPAVYQGDTLIVTGKLRPALGSYQARISYASIEVTAHHATIVDQLRRRFAAGIQSALPEPLASFGMGLLIGQRNTLPDSVKQDLLMVGLTHIIAVSGYNLTILLRASKGILAKRSKRQATALAFGLIAVFLLFTGSSPSIIRAAIVSALSIATAYYGRSVKPLVLICLAAAITAFANPFYVWSDAGWYLSFLAFYGVMVIAPLIARRWPSRWREALLFNVALESLCAELMTLPFVLHTFGQVSFIGLLANLLIATMVPFAMLFSLIAGLAGLLLPMVAGWFAVPANLLLTYMLDTAHLLSRVPHVFKEHLGFSMVELIGMYALLAAVTYLLWLKGRLQRGIITGNSESRKGA